jgi:hypothetical protein
LVTPFDLHTTTLTENSSTLELAKFAATEVMEVPAWLIPMQKVGPPGRLCFHSKGLFIKNRPSKWLETSMNMSRGSLSLFQMMLLVNNCRYFGTHQINCAIHSTISKAPASPALELKFDVDGRQAAGKPRQEWNTSVISLPWVADWSQP